MSTFTPGPWFVVNDGTEDEPMLSVKAARISGRPPNHEVALCATGDSPQEMENANANLIATAPDLLEALEKLSGYFPTIPPSDGVIPNALILAARAAIAKARGEK